MAGVVPQGREAHDAHWGRIIAGPAFVVRTVVVDGAVAGYVSAFVERWLLGNRLLARP